MTYQSRPFLAASIVAMAVFFFALGDVVSKTLALTLPVPVFAAGRYIVSILILLVVLYPRKGRKLWAANNPKLLIFRGLLLSFATLTMGLALRLLPVAETVAILYLFPFVVIALSVPIFGDHVMLLGWGFVVLGFVGVILVLTLTGTLNPLGVLFALLNVAISVGFHLISRKVSRTESASTMIFYVSLVGAIYFTFTALPYLAEAKFNIENIGLMILLSFLATSGHFLLPIAYRYAEASTVAPLNYLHLVWATLLGWIFFKQMPNAWGIMGIVLIIISGIGITLLAQKQRAKAS